MVKKIIGKTYIYFILFVMYLPIFLLIIYSFQNTNRPAIGVYHPFTLKLYKDLFNLSIPDSKGLWIAVLHTLEIALAAAACSTIIGTLGAIGIFYSNIKVKKVVNGMANISIVNAEIVTALSLRILYAFLGIELNFLTLLIGHVVLTVPFVVLNILPKLQQMDPNEYEAALDLGATPIKALFKVVIPEIMPGIISGFLLSITLSLDDYIITAYTSHTTYKTISTFVYEKMVKAGVPLQFRSLTTIIFILIFIGVLIYGIIMKKKNKKINDHSLGR